MDESNINAQYLGDSKKHGKITIILEDIDGVPYHASCVMDKNSIEGAFSERTRHIVALALAGPTSLTTTFDKNSELA